MSLYSFVETGGSLSHNHSRHLFFFFSILTTNIFVRYIIIQKPNFLNMQIYIRKKKYFCFNQFYPTGCPTCESTSTETSALFQSSRALSTYEGWAAWCNVQCRQGMGGAACNCDRAPFQ